MVDKNIRHVSVTERTLATALGDDRSETEEDGVTTFFNASISTYRRELARTESSHGFTVRQPLHCTITTGVWVLADADAGLPCHAICAEVVDSNTFIPASSGLIPSAAHGLTLGGIYYLQDTAGTVGTTTPGLGSIQQRVFFVPDANFIQVLIEWGDVP